LELYEVSVQPEALDLVDKALQEWEIEPVPPVSVYYLNNKMLSLAFLWVMMAATITGKKFITCSEKMFKKLKSLIFTSNFIFTVI
jgi:hypothetical protein